MEGAVLRGSGVRTLVRVIACAQFRNREREVQVLEGEPVRIELELYELGYRRRFDG